MATKAGPGRPRKFTPDEVKAALEKSGGVMSLAAKGLGCSRRTVYRTVQRYPELRETIRDIEEDALDDAELGLRELIAQRDGASIRFFLQTKGKHRGYARSVELEGLGIVSPGEPDEEIAARREKYRGMSGDDALEFETWLASRESVGKTIN